MTTTVTASAPAPPFERLKALFLDEVSRAPLAAAGVWFITIAACFGSLWSERFPFNSGDYIAWSLHPRISSPPVFHPLTGVTFTFVMLLLVALCWTFTAFGAASGRISLRVAAAGALALPALALVPPAILSEDTASYWAYGRIAAVHHDNPFVASPMTHSTDPSFWRVADVWKDMPSNYGPGFTVIAAFVAKASGESFLVAVLLFKLIALFGVLAVSLLLLRSGTHGPRERALRLVMWGWNPIVTLYLVGGGHNDALVAVGLAIAAVGVLDRRHGIAFAGIALAALMKPIAIIAALVYCAWLWLRTPARATAVAGAMASVGTLALSYAPYWHGGRAMEPLRRIAWRIEDAVPVGWIASPTSRFIGSGGGLFARLLSFTMVGVIAVWALRRIDRIDPLEAIALGFGAVLLASTYSQPWYLVWMLVPLLFAGRSALNRWWRPAVILCAIWAVKAVRNQPRFRAPDSLRFEGLVHWIEGGLTVALVIAMLYTLRRPPGRPAFPELLELTEPSPKESVYALKAATTSRSLSGSLGANPE